ncbi:MAG TPA: GNAT family N-acetyltransferase [Woeseiaceae bacterium]
MTEPPSELRTDRLLLRAPVADDASAIFDEYAADPDVTRYLMWAPHQKLETVVEFLQDLIDRRLAGQEFSWLLTLPEEGRAIGMIVARVQDCKAEIGYVLGRKHWNRGYMAEAISAVAEWCLSQPEMFRVSAICDTENVASARALEKAGFKREGELSRWIKLPNRSSEPRDCYIYGRVR